MRDAGSWQVTVRRRLKGRKERETRSSVSSGGTRRKRDENDSLGENSSNHESLLRGSDLNESALDEERVGDPSSQPRANVDRLGIEEQWVHVEIGEDWRR